MSNELVTIDNYCEVSKTSLIFKRDVTKEEWQSVFDACNHIEGCIQFWVGDLLKYREQKWGMYDDVTELSGRDKGTLMNYKSVSDSVKPSLRHEDLTFSHHQQVAPLPPEKQREFLEKASSGKMSVRELKNEIRKEEIERKISLSPIFKSKSIDINNPEYKYRVIYADPPWSYGNTMPEYFTEQADHYSLMPLPEICDMPIKGISEDNAVLFIWVTSPILEEAFQVINSWGFKYKSSFIWDKVSHNMGHYNSVRHELLLIATRGSCQPDVPKLYDSVQSIERGSHSKKPEGFREIIDHIYPVGRRIELFARKINQNWDAYGNEI